MWNWRHNCFHLKQESLNYSSASIKCDDYYIVIIIDLGKNRNQKTTNLLLVANIDGCAEYYCLTPNWVTKIGYHDLQDFEFGWVTLVSVYGV